MEKTGREVRKLADTFTLNGYIYKLVKRTPKKGLYAQYNDAGMLIAHELVKITTLKAGKVFNKEYPKREHYPSNEEIGKLGWSITSDPEKAEKMFDNFVKFQKR